MISLQDIVKEFEKKHESESKSVGVSTMMKHKGRYLFVLSKEKYWTPFKDGTKINYSCVGGKLEEGESFQEALLREAREEIDSDLRLLPNRKTFYVDSDNNVSEVDITDEFKPRIIFEQKVLGKPGDPSANGFWYLLVPVFYSEALTNPRPSSEIPALIMLNGDMYKSTLKTNRLSTIMSQGGILIKQREIPDETYIEPLFTAKVIGNLFTGKLEEMFPI